jgi:hypothetical protein
MNSRIFLLLLACLVASGCDDSKKPLSDPKTTKADERLIGIWRDTAGSTEDYFHVGRAGKNFPPSMLRIVSVRHGDGTVEPPEEYLAFPTVLQGKSYLNVVIDPKQVKHLDENGWKPETVDCYTFLRYEVQGDRLTVWLIDEQAKERAVKDGKIKGVMKDNIAQFTDTTENVARFVAEAGDSLLNTKEPGRLERVKMDKKR